MSPGGYLACLGIGAVVGALLVGMVWDKDVRLERDERRQKDRESAIHNGHCAWGGGRLIAAQDRVFCVDPDGIK